MTVYKVYYYPHAILKKPATTVEQFTDQLRDFLRNLSFTAEAFEGGGIAAPQVGISKRIFMSDFSQSFENKDSPFEKKEDDFLVFDAQGKPKDYTFPMYFINPEIVSTNQGIKTNWEGCLSFPDVEPGDIQRFHEVEIKAQDEHGNFFSVKTSHLYAAVNFQHEVDHLNGVTMINHWPKNSYRESEVIQDIQGYLNSSKVRKRLKKLNLVDAQKEKFDF